MIKNIKLKTKETIDHASSVRLNLKFNLTCFHPLFSVRTLLTRYLYCLTSSKMKKWWRPLHCTSWEDWNWTHVFTKNVNMLLTSMLFLLLFTYHTQPHSIIRGTQFSENICSEDDLRSRIFGKFVVKFLACLPLLGFSNF